MSEVQPDVQCDAEIQRILTVLRTSMRILGVTNREIEKRLGVSVGYLSRLFHGSVELKVEHVLAITQAIGLHPAELFHLLYPQLPARPTEASLKLRSALEGFRPAPPPSPAAPEKPGAHAPSEEDLERLMMSSLRKLLAGLGREPG
ncbi:MAG TPA: helix-turn-helix transcriptional regulator [Thermoanaerobaculia bacterium]|nr:helix-turn-helix transcriptional regulator [Thermoanaerobaculia bacterium]